MSTDRTWSGGTDAHASRRALLRAIRAEGEAPAWALCLHRAEQGIESSLRLIERSVRALQESERTVSWSRRLRAIYRLRLIPQWMGQAAERLDRSAQGLRETTLCVRADSACGTGIPERLTAATDRWIEAAGRLAWLSDEVEETFDRLQAEVEAAAAAADAWEASEARAAIRALAAEAIRGFLGRRRVRLLRHRRIRPLRTEDAIRRISRGRAPPFASTCQL